jgi:hypothetical protein
VSNRDNDLLELKRTPGKAEGVDDDEIGDELDFEPGMTPYQAEGDDDLVEEDLRSKELLKREKSA